jgi:hypothetical protein
VLLRAVSTTGFLLFFPEVKVSVTNKDTATDIQYKEHGRN